MPEGARLGRQAIALAEESGDPELYMIVGTSAYSLFSIGELREGVAILDRAIELANGDPTLGAGVGVACPLANCLITKGGFLAPMGRFEAARTMLERGMNMAREQGDIENMGWGHMWSTWLAHLSGDPEGAHAHAQQSLQIAERIGDAFSRAYAWLWVGMAEVMRGEWAQARDAVERSLELAK